MVLGDRHDEPRPGLLEQSRPGVRVIVLRRELGDEVFVAELGLRPVGFDVVLELRRPLLVHVAGIPLAAESGDAVQPPMNEDAELGVPSYQAGIV